MIFQLSDFVSSMSVCVLFGISSALSVFKWHLTEPLTVTVNHDAAMWRAVTLSSADGVPRSAESHSVDRVMLSIINTHWILVWWLHQSECVVRHCKASRTQST